MANKALGIEVLEERIRQSIEEEVEHWIDSEDREHEAAIAAVLALAGTLDTGIRRRVAVAIREEWGVDIEAFTEPGVDPGDVYVAYTVKNGRS